MNAIIRLLMCSLCMMLASCDPKPEDNPTWETAYRQAREESEKSVTVLLLASIDSYEKAYNKALSGGLVSAKIIHDDAKPATLRQLVADKAYNEASRLVGEAVYNTTFWQTQKLADAPELAAEARRKFEAEYSSTTNILPRLNQLYADATR